MIAKSSFKSSILRSTILHPRLVFILATFVIGSFPAHAVTLEGIGYGETDIQARKNALSALSESLFVEVKSEFQSTTSSSGKSVSQQDIKTRSDLPLLGTKVSIQKHNEEFEVIARINSQRSLSLYINQLSSVKKNIDKNYQAFLNNKDSNVKYNLINNTLGLLDQHKKLLLVASVLGYKNSNPLDIDEIELRRQLTQLEMLVPSFGVAAKLLSTDIPGNRIYVDPPTPSGSNEITTFSYRLYDAIVKRLSSTKTPQEAAHRFIGQYEILDNGVYVSYWLVDENNNTLTTRNIMLAPEAYKSISYKPKLMNFDRLLHQGVVVSNNLQANLATQIGRERLLFKSGDEIEILVKLNQPGYFYIVGHVQTRKPHSYLLELGEGTGNRKFVRYINADDANKWISIGAFEVTAPYGTESLQLFASNVDLVNNVPTTHYDPANELYIISNNPLEAVTKTRALKLKKTKSTKTTESVLMFTTIPVN